MTTISTFSWDLPVDHKVLVDICGVDISRHQLEKGRRSVEKKEQEELK